MSDELKELNSQFIEVCSIRNTPQLLQDDAGHTVKYCKVRYLRKEGRSGPDHASRMSIV